MSLSVVILAAGQGTRMHSSLPKVMHTLAGKPLLGWVLDAAERLAAEQIVVVHGKDAELVKESFSDRDIAWALQDEQKGTGHAVQQALPQLSSKGQVLVLYGDVPLIDPETLEDLVQAASNQLGILTVHLENPQGYGRILRDTNGSVTGIVEQKDASTAEQLITEVNTGIMCIPAQRLHAWLPQLSNDNAQGEYYLTDLVTLAVSDGVAAVTRSAKTPEEVAGVNTRAQMADLERHFQREQAEKLLNAGVSLADPARFDVRGSLTVGRDVYIDANVIFEGEVTLEDGVRVESNCLIRQSHIKAGAVIRANSVLESARVGPEAEVGPFARLRPGTELDAKAKIGNFVEVKKSHIGAGSKVNHLSYVGDAEIGKGVNMGAGTITANYDGVNKHKTVIADGASTGSNSVLVAPVTVGANAYIGAGSVITKDIPAGNLAIARGRQKNMPRKKEN